MPWYGWLICITILMVLILIIGGLLIANKIAKPNRRSLLETAFMEEEQLPGIMDFYKYSVTDEYSIQTRDGLKLQAYYMKNEVESNRYIVMSHGHTYTHHGVVKYARMMMKYGFNIVLYDQRFHGNSEGNFSSLGYKEKDDLYDVITHTFTKYGKDIYLGTYGESMGSSTVLCEVEKDDRVRFVFSDCGFSNLHNLVGEFITKFKFVPKWPFMDMASLMFRVITGSRFSGISPIKAISNVRVPIFFAHGKADKYINYQHTLKLYESYKGPKAIFIGENDSPHAGSYIKDTEKYELEVKKFIEENLKTIK